MRTINLPDVTLLGIDSIDVDRLGFAIEVCQRHITFGGVKLLTHLPSSRGDVVQIEPITSIKEYSSFVMTKLHEYVTTTHVLLVQWDGFILNPAAWNDHFLDYDYIGARWRHLSSLTVGNGGFSLRSKRLLECVARDDSIRGHPEDTTICRKFGERLRDKGLRFAPPETADRFSIEMWVWESEFGFHKADISRWPIHDFTDAERHAASIETFYRYFPRRQAGTHDTPQESPTDFPAERALLLDSRTTRMTTRNAGRHGRSHDM